MIACAIDPTNAMLRSLEQSSEETGNHPSLALVGTKRTVRWLSTRSSPESENHPVVEYWAVLNNEMRIQYV